MPTAVQDVRAVVVPADRHNPVRVERVNADGIARIVRGQCGVVLLGDMDAIMYVNEYGKFMDCGPNPRATRLVDRYVPGFSKIDTIMGDVVLVGVDSDGQAVSVPPEVESAATGRPVPVPSL